MGCDVSLLGGIEMFDLLHGDDRQALADVVDAIKLNPAETLSTRVILAIRCS